jgi:uncharacterized protein YprB with RNaseH-like and TPR domain
LSNLRDRLKLYQAAGKARAAAPAPTTLNPETVPSGAVQSLKGGQTRPLPSGEAFYMETRTPLAEGRGFLPLDRPLPATTWQRLGLPPDLSLQRAAFFDTETTGLAGGTGTWVFLVGIGYYEGAHFVIRQYFLRDYPEEAAMLEAIHEEFSRFDLLVSFNGKSFDWPLLETRFRLARMRPPLPGAPHLDLLHPSRRVWGGQLPNAKLTTLEGHLMGIERVGDVGGAEIPPLYFDFLRTGESGPLLPVIEHNRLDILSLASLAGHLGGLVTEPLAPTPDGVLYPGDDLFGAAQILMHRGEWALALECLEGALDRGTSSITAEVVLKEKGFLLKRLQEFGQAEAVWQACLEAGSRSMVPYVELAKHYEHRTKELPRALELTRAALALAERRFGVTRSVESRRELEEIQHRLARLERRLERQA